MIHVYLKSNEINGYSDQQIKSYTPYRFDHRLEKHSSFFNFPLKDSSEQRYVYPIRLTGPLVKRSYTFLPKDHIFHIPDHVLADVRSNRCKIVFDFSSETYDCTFSNKNNLVDYFVKRTLDFYLLTKNQVIVITGNVRAYRDTPYLVSVLMQPVSYINVATKDWCCDCRQSIIDCVERPYKVVSLMRQTKTYRARFASDIFHNNLKIDNLITFHLPRNKQQFSFSLQHIPYLQNKDFVNSLPWQFDDIGYNLSFGDTKENDIIGISKEQDDLFLNSYVHFVMESFPEPESTNQLYELDFSEKIYKPISRLQPFVTHAQPGLLSYLKEIGYKTFDRWWDESYDNDTDVEVRYNKVFELFKKISLTSKSELSAMLLEMLPTLEHNLEMFNKTVSNKTYLDDFNAVLSTAFNG